MTGASINWFPRWKEGGPRVLCSCEGFLNVPLMGTKGCINYNPMLAIKQFGFLNVPLRGAPSKETIMPFIARGFNEANTKILQKICKAWNEVGRKDKELRGRNNGVISDYHKWLKSRTQGIAWLKKLKGLNGEEGEVPEESEEVQALKAELKKTKVAKEKLKVAVTRVRKECDKLKDINMTAAKALKRETKKARKEEWSRDKFRGALLGNNNDLELRKAEKDKSRMENVMLKDKLRNCQRSKGSLKEQLSKTEDNMLIVID